MCTYFIRKMVIKILFTNYYTTVQQRVLLVDCIALPEFFRIFQKSFLGSLHCTVMKKFSEFSEGFSWLTALHYHVKNF